MLIELGNAHPQDVLTDPDGTEHRVDLGGPRVTYVNVPEYDYGPHVGLDRIPGESDEQHAARHAVHVAQGTRPGPVAVFPRSHDDSLLNDELARGLAPIPEGPDKWATRRLFISGHLSSHPEGITHLPNHEVFVAIAHPRDGAWQRVSAPGTKPTWVSCPDAPHIEEFLANFYDCPRGRPAGLEDTHWTQHGSGVFPPGAIPPPEADVTMLHTSWGRDVQAIKQFWWPQMTQLGLSGTATASSATSLTGGTETSSFNHASNDAAGMLLIILTPGGDAAKWAFIKSNTSGTAPVYTVDRWYSVGSPGGAAAATPSSTATYTVVPGTPEQFIALTTDSTTPALGGSAGTADAPAATTTLTSELNFAGGGLTRKIYTTLTHTAGAATVVSTTTFTCNGSDTLPQTIAKAAMCTSIVGGGAGLSYMTLVSPTATVSASGDQLTLTWTFTET